MPGERQRLIWHEPGGTPEVARWEIEHLGKHVVVRYQHRVSFLRLKWWKTYAETSTKSFPVGPDEVVRDWIDEAKSRTAGRVADYFFEKLMEMSE